MSDGFVREQCDYISKVTLKSYTPSSESKNHSNKSQKSLAADFCKLLILYIFVENLKRL